MRTPGPVWESRLASVATVLVGLTSGPWPALPPSSLLWRIPLGLVALAVVWRARGWVRRAVVAALACAGLAIDGAAPAALDPAAWAARASAGVVALQRRLEALADEPALRAMLEAGGSEAAPEAPFREIARSREASDLAADVLVVVDERGTPIAWLGKRARLPMRLRLIGERSIAAEAGVEEAWLWWREPVLEGGRTLGELLAGVVLPEGGSRSALGVSAGRAAVVAPRWDGGATLLSPSGVRLLGVDVRPARPVLWSTAGWAAVAALLVVTASARGAARWPLLAVAVTAGLAAAAAGTPWWVVVLLVGVAISAHLLVVRWSAGGVRVDARLRVLSVAIAAGSGALVWVTSGLIAARQITTTPESLLMPAPWQAALVVAWTAVFVVTRPPLPRLAWWARLLAWVPLAAGTLLAEPWLLAAGSALVVLAGLPAGSLVLPAVAAGLVMVGCSDTASRATLTGTVEWTLARVGGEAEPARAMLGSIPESGLTELVRLSPGEMLVVLGRLAGWLGFGDALPGASLALVSADQEVAAIWGQQFGGWGVPPREVAVRELGGGWRLAVLVAERPYNVLAAFAAAGIQTPAAAFDRSGAPVGRGAVFRPLPPDRVGRALADSRSWGRIRVGERDLSAYLRAYDTWVMAVPWLRVPWPELALAVAGLALWGVLPFAAWRYRVWARDLVALRRTFAGRLRLLSAAATLVPLLLLAQLLPRQWVRQQRQARLELGRVLSQPLAATGVNEQLPWLVRDMGATVGLYREGRLIWCSRPDLAAVGEVPSLAPAEAFARAVRGWREPLITGESRVSVFVPMPGGQPSDVAAVLGLQVGTRVAAATPGQWFVIAGLWAAVLSLSVAERVGRRIAGPLRRLVQATVRLERGEPVAGLEVQGDEEILTLGHAFETMAATVQRREEELRRERDLLDRVLGALSAAVVVVDAGGATELANQSARRLLGEGDHLAELRQRFGPAVDSLLDQASRGESVITTARSAASPEALFQVTAMPLAGMSGRRVVVMEDLSEVARAERLASLAELARIVAHEVKNPLTPIRLWAEELRAALDEGTPRIAEIARTASEQILDRVAHLREVAQGFSNLVALEHWERHRILLGPLVHEVVGEYAVTGKRGITIREERGGEGAVIADPSWVRRAVRHLLDNSLRAIGQREGEIALTVVETEEEVILAVRDSGGGVPQENLARLFEPHFSTTSEGSGLGLAVVRRVLERAGGRAEARNVGDGLEVRLVFPHAAATV